MVSRATRRFGVASVCLVVGAALPIPVAWAWAYLYFAHSYHENTAVFTRPEAVASTIESIDIQNGDYPGVRWVNVAGWPPGMTGSRFASRSNPGEPYDSDPTYPWAAREVLPALADLAKWPTPVCGRPVANTNTGVSLVQMEAMGWPCYCAQGRADWTGAAPASFNSRGLMYAQGFSYNSWARGGQVALCYLPMWPGYAIDAIVYAVVLTALVEGLISLHKQHRRRRGVCEGCGYDLRGLPLASPCPECGQLR